MNFDDLESVANAVLYEGYLLYPYRRSSIKNRVRFPFGGIYPAAYCADQAGADQSAVHAECLVRAGSSVVIKLKFLQLQGDDAVERGLEFELPLTAGLEHEQRFEWLPVRGACRSSVTALGSNLYRLRVRIENTSDSRLLERDAVLHESLLSAHLLLGVRDGSFVSLLEPAPELAAAASACGNRGLFPVLVGSRDRADRMLASPIILYDYPEVAAQSPGDLFDSTEIDEILSLRILTLSDAEKREMRADPRARALLERTEGLSAEALFELHGALRKPVREGDRVRLRPKRRADIFDIALAGRVATVRSVERDFENRVYVCVTVEGDPGEDLGIQGQPGHRFFFDADEVEPIDPRGGC